MRKEEIEEAIRMKLCSCIKKYGSYHCIETDVFEHVVSAIDVDKVLNEEDKENILEALEFNVYPISIRLADGKTVYAYIANVL